MNRKQFLTGVGFGARGVLPGLAGARTLPSAFALLNLDSAYGAHVSGLHLVGDVSYKKKVYGIWGRSGRPETYEEEDSMFIDECKVELFSGDAIRLDHVEAFRIRHSMIYHNRGDGFHSDGSADGEETRPRILKSFGRKVTAFLFAAAASLAALAGEPFAVFPESCATPDGMAVDPRGRLVIAAPNFADPSKPGVLFRIDRPGEKPYVWVTVPPHPRTGHAVPMGISFGDEGELYVCDNQGRFAAYEGRLLRFTFRDDKLAACETVAEGMESPNGCEYHDGAIWMTQSTVRLLDQGAGTAASFVYRFGKDERNVRITNSREDVNIVAEIATENRFSHGGANALCFGKDGALYVTHFGDGAILRYELTSGGRKLTGERTFAVTDFDYTLDPKAPGFLDKAVKAKMRSADGICLGPDGAFYVADFVNNAVCRVSPKGEITVLKQSPDGNGLDGGLNQPSETIFWQGHLVVANFDASCGTPNVNTKSDRPCTLVEVQW